MAETIRYEKWTPDGPTLEEVELDTEADFGTDDSNIDGELCKVGPTLCRYGILQAELRAALARAETEVDNIVSHYDGWFRNPANYSGKLTEVKLKELIRQQPAWKAAVDKVNETRLNFYKVDNLHKALNRRADAINNLSHNFRAEVKHT